MALPAGAKEEKTMSRLDVSLLLTLNSEADGEKLSKNDRQQVMAVVPGLFGGTRPASFERAIEALAGEEMGLYKLRLTRDGKAEWDLWINTLKDDGIVFPPDSPEPNGLGISQQRVHDSTEHRDAICEEISEAVYRSGFTFPSYQDWGEE
jgi:hypothetical protein